MDQPSDLAGLPLRPLSDAGGGASGSAAAHALPAFMQQQFQSNWCWSAVGTSVGLFFKTGSWTQCGTVSALLKNTTCCNNPTPSTCNVYGYLDQSLTYTGSFNKLIYGTYSAADMQAQIEAGRPVCVRVAWNGGAGAHFLAMTGYSVPAGEPSSVMVYLQDSFYGASSMAFADFPANYHVGGEWTHTYLTQPSA